MENIRLRTWAAQVDAVRDQFREALLEGERLVSAGGEGAPASARAFAKSAVAEAKKQLPGVTWSGTFSRRSSDSLLVYSGLICADIDDLEPDRIASLRNALRQCPHVFGSFASPTSGLKVLFAVDPEPGNHRRYFEGIGVLMRDNYGVSIDPSGKDLCRLCFVSSDPDAWVNEAAEPLPVLLEPSPATTSDGLLSARSERPGMMDIGLDGFVATGCESTARVFPQANEDPLPAVEDALRHISADCPRAPWLKVGMALHTLGESGWALWVRWSKTAPTRWVETEAGRDWDSFGRSRSQGGIGLGTIFAAARSCGWAGVLPPPPGSGLRIPAPRNRRQIPRRGGCAAGVDHQQVSVGGMASAVEASTAAGDQDPGDSEQEDTLPEGSDASRALEFVDRFCQIIRYVPEWKRWIVFESGRWNAREDGGLLRLSCQLATEVLATIQDVRHGLSAKVEIQTITESATAFASARNVSSMATFASTDRRIIISPEDLDADPWLVGAPNGVLNLRTGQITPHSPEQLITKSLGCDLDPNARAPQWVAFLERVLPDPEVRAYVQKAAGYSLTGLTTEHHFLFLYGLGCNGKSTLLETLFAGMGGYAGKAAESLLYSSDRGATPPDVIAEIAGVRFLVGAETHEGARLNEGSIKDICGGDTLRGARKYEHGFKFRPVAKLWMVGNHKPAIRGNDDGIWRRVRLIDFPVQIPVEERDPGLPSKLLLERPGILNWMAEGARLWQRDGLQPPPTVRAACAGYRQDEDVLGDFLAERTQLFAPSSANHNELFKAYQAWAEASGLRYALNSRILAKRLRERGWSDAKDGRGNLIWRGIRLLHLIN